MGQYQAARSKHQKPITVTRSINQWPQYQQQSNSSISFKHSSEYYEFIVSIERFWRSSNKYKSRERFWRSSNGYIKHQTQEDIQELGAMFLAVQDNSISDLVTHWITQYYCQSVNWRFDFSVFRPLQSLSWSFLTIDQKDEEAWYDQQGDKDKNVHTKVETKTLKIVDEKNLSTVLKMTLWRWKYQRYWEGFSDLLKQMTIPEKLRNSNHDIEG